jgi:hypothetical protein
MKRWAHAVAGTLALTLITLFFTASVLAEAFGDGHAVAVVKTAVLYALAVLVPAMALTGATGRSLAAPRRRAPLVRRKQRRMAAAASIGFTVLVPCAVFLWSRASARDFGTPFAIVQAVELAGGAVNIALLGLNVRDGRLLSAGSRRRGRSASVGAGV